MAFDSNKCLKFTCLSGSVILELGPSQIDSSMPFYFSKTGDPDSWVANSIPMNVGESVYVKGTLPPKGSYFWCHTAPVGTLAVSGNVMSLVDDGAGALSEITEIGAFKELFKNLRYLIEISDNLLPATILSEECYRGLFSGCINLKTISDKFKLPAKELPKLCYAEMFYGTNLLQEAPENLFPNPVVLGYENFYKMFEMSNIKKVSEEFFPKIKGKGEEFLYPFCDIFQGCSYLEEIHFPYTSWEEKVGPGGKLIPMTSGWVTNVKDTGVFYCSSALTTKYDNSHIPINWRAIPLKPKLISVNFLNKVKMGGYK